MSTGLRRLLANWVDDAADLARRVLPRDSTVRRLLRRAARHVPLPDPRPQVSRFLLAFAATRPHAFFIQIGSNDGDQQDPLRPVIQRYPWRGILVEPVPYVFEKLRRNRGGEPGLILENVAIADVDGTLPFYHLAKADDASQLPRWYDALGSFRREVVLKHVEYIPDIASRVREIAVACLTFDSLCRKHGVARVDVLHMDVEGYDWQLMQSIDLARWRPAALLFEHHHLDVAARQACRAHLEALGYALLSERLDTLAVHLASVTPEVAQLFRREQARLGTML